VHVQVTNSALDDETRAFAASKLIIRRDLSSGGNVTTAPSFTPIVLTAGVAAQLCGVTGAAGTSCLQALPATARPNATPMAVLKMDGSGFQLISTWYQPPVDACNQGVTYLTIHDFTVTGGVVQKFGMKVASEPVTSAVFVGGRLMFVTKAGVTDLTSVLPSSASYAPIAKASPAGSTERFRKLAWMEEP
jgi:hypothetical protein